MLDGFVSRAFLLLLFLVVGCSHGPGSELGSVERQPPSIGGGQPIGPEGQAALHAILEAGNLPDLRWPDFSDYREDVAKFYEANGSALSWVREMQATSQAQAIIAVLQSASEKGLSADDYDGPRWRERLARLRPATGSPKNQMWCD